MSRSKWKGFFLCHSLYKKYLYLKKANINTFIKVYNRSSTVLCEFVGAHFKIYNGKRFINVFVTEEKAGHKFGEFSYTRKIGKCIHVINNKKKRKIKDGKNKK